MLKHPNAVGINLEAMLDERDRVEPVIFEQIDINLIRKIAMNISGSGGPSQVDADTWRIMICSKVYKNNAVELAASVANAAKKLATKNIEPHVTESLLACRLIPLEKKPSGDR